MWGRKDRPALLFLKLCGVSWLAVPGVVMLLLLFSRAPEAGPVAM